MQADRSTTINNCPLFFKQKFQTGGRFYPLPFFFFFFLHYWILPGSNPKSLVWFSLYQTQYKPTQPRQCRHLSCSARPLAEGAKDRAELTHAWLRNAWTQSLWLVSLLGPSSGMLRSKYHSRQLSSYEKLCPFCPFVQYAASFKKIKTFFHLTSVSI